MLNRGLTRRLDSAKRRRSTRHQLGMSLVEVMVSAVVFAIGILGLMNAHAVAFSSFSDAKFRVDAALLADRLIGEMWVDRTNMTSYALAPNTTPAYGRLTPWLTQVNQALPSSTASIVIVGNTVRVTVSWQPPGTTARSHVAVATLQEP